MILKEKIVICNKCKTRLRVPNRLLEAARQTACPKCKNMLFVNFIEEGNGDDAEDEAEDPTVLGGKFGSAPTPYLEFNGNKYYIEKKNTVIGRKAATSNADIQLDTNDMYMGRHHAEIIKTDYYGTCNCILKAKDAKNGLSVNGIEMSNNDAVKLLDGAHIKMGNTVVAFRID